MFNVKKPKDTTAQHFHLNPGHFKVRLGGAGNLHVRTCYDSKTSNARILNGFCSCALFTNIFFALAKIVKLNFLIDYVIRQ